MTQTFAATAPAATLMRSPLIPSHTRWLESAGISAEAAGRFDVFSAETVEDICTWHGADDIVCEQAESLARALPGVVFPWRQLSGQFVMQLHPDTPVAADSAARSPKYLSARGYSLGIWVPEVMADHLDTASVLLIVEGTKQTIQACRYAPDDVLVVGLPGIQGWSEPREKDEDGQPVGERTIHGDLETIIGGENIRTVIVVPDADWRSNPAVGASVRQMVAAIVATGDVDSRHVRVADLTSFAPAESKSGVDDILAPLTDAERAETIARLIRDAHCLPKPRTPRAAAIGDMVVDVQQGVIRTPDKIIEGITVPGGVALGAAVRMVRTRTAVDPGAPDDQSGAVVSADLEVTIGSGETPEGFDPSLQTKRILERVPDSEIDDPRTWLGPRLGGIGQRIAVATSPSERRAVGNAIRTSSLECEDITEVATVGHWTSQDGERYWVPGRGPALHIVDGRLTEDPTVVGAVPSGTAAHITVHAADATAEKVRAAAQTWAGLMDDLAWTPAAVSVFGHAAAALMGFRREGREDRYGIMFLSGRPGSGKTELAHGALSLLGRDFASQAGLTFRATDGALGAFDDHLQPGTLTMVDDFTGRCDQRQDQPQLIDDMARKTYDGSSRPRQTRDGRGGFRTVSPRRDEAMLIITGERQPASLTSALERTLVMQVPFHPWDAACPGRGAEAFGRFAAAVQGGAIEPLGAELVSHGLEHHRDVMSRVRHWREWLLETHGWDQRPRQLAAPVLAGVSALMELADVPDAQGQRVIKSIVDAVQVYWTGISDDSTSDPVQVVLDSLRGAVASGRFALDGATTALTASSTMLGSARSIGGEPVVCIIPSVASQITGQSIAQLNALLRPVVVPGGDGRAQKKVRIGTGSMRLFVLPEAVWAGTPDGAVLDPVDVGDAF